MTNTHINVGGHKITTNKVGTTKTLTLESGFSGLVYYTVTNGVCVLCCNYLSATHAIGSGIIVAKNLPKPKISVPAGTYYNWNSAEIFGVMYLLSGDTNLYLNLSTTNISGYAAMTYPVADDWVES